MTKISLDQEIQERLQALREDPARLMRYDRNGDGKIDAEEWAAIERIVTAEAQTKRRRETKNQDVASQPAPSQGDAVDVLNERYILQESIGAGAQGQVFLAWDQQTGAEVLLKALRFEHLEDLRQLDLFEQNAQLLKELDHPAIPRFIETFRTYDADDKLKHFYLAREFVEGAPLDDIIADAPPISEEAAWDFLEQMLHTLIYLHIEHAPALIHRDIKPSNIIQKPDGSWALIDFGAAQRGSAAPDDFHTAGTFGYMPLEQMMGRAEPASDLYAVAATLVHLLSRTHPADLAMRGMRLEFEAVTQTSEELRQILSYMLEPEVEDRPRSASALLERVERARQSWVERQTRSHQLARAKPLDLAALQAHLDTSSQLPSVELLAPTGPPPTRLKSTWHSTPRGFYYAYRTSSAKRTIDTIWEIVIGAAVYVGLPLLILTSLTIALSFAMPFISPNPEDTGDLSFFYTLALWIAGAYILAPMLWFRGGHLRRRLALRLTELCGILTRETLELHGSTLTLTQDEQATTRSAHPQLSAAVARAQTKQGHDKTHILLIDKRTQHTVALAHHLPLAEQHALADQLNTAIQQAATHL